MLLSVYEGSRISRIFCVKVDRRARRRHGQWYVLAGFALHDAPHAVFHSIVDVRGDSAGAVLGQRDMPVAVPSGAFGQTAQKTVDFLQLPFLAGRRQPCHGAEADSHGLACLEDHRDSAIAVCFLVVAALLCRSCLLCLLLSTTGAYNPELCRNSWRFRSRSSFLVVDVAVSCSDKLSRDSSSPEIVDISVATETGTHSYSCAWLA